MIYPLLHLDKWLSIPKKHFIIKGKWLWYKVSLNVVGLRLSYVEHVGQKTNLLIVGL